MNKLSLWLETQALPFWWEYSFSVSEKRFLEQLQTDGRADTLTPTRGRVPSRQIYAFAKAANEKHPLFLTQAEAILHRFDLFWTANWGHDCLAKAQDGDARGLPRTAAPHCANDTSPALAYDQAFGLLALGQLYQLSAGDARIKSRLSQLWDFVIEGFAHPAGGFYSVYKQNKELTLEQNPNMHLFECSLFLFDATRDEKYLRVAETLLALFKSKLLDPKTMALREFFDPDWKALDGKEQRIEPGHMLEWIALLNHYERLTGHSCDVDLKAMFDSAVEIGLMANGLVCDFVSDQELSSTWQARCWPQTELLRASIVMADKGHKLAADLSPSCVADRLMSEYLAQPIESGWLDSPASGDNLKTRAIPASTLYHLVNAAYEYKTHVTD